MARSISPVPIPHIPETVEAVIEIFDESPLPFKEDDWIGKNKKFPSNPIDVNEGLRAYCENLRAIPPKVVLEHIPVQTSLSNHFLSSSYPKLEQDL
jgi:hypothetical protein